MPHRLKSDARCFASPSQRTVRRVELLALARSHRHMPARTFGFVSLAHALVSRIAEGVFLIDVQQRAGLRDVGDVGRRALHRVHEAGLGAHADVRLHAEVPLLALLGPAHLRIARAALVLGRARRDGR